MLIRRVEFIIYLQHLPETALLPLGTGNDLSRSIGWGAHMESKLDFAATLRSIANATTKPLDRSNSIYQLRFA